jgi:hypothetical protein
MAFLAQFGLGRKKPNDLANLFVSIAFGKADQLIHFVADAIGQMMVGSAVHSNEEMFFRFQSFFHRGHKPARFEFHGADLVNDHKLRFLQSPLDGGHPDLLEIP